MWCFNLSSLGWTYNSKWLFSSGLSNRTIMVLWRGIAKYNQQNQELFGLITRDRRNWNCSLTVRSCPTQIILFPTHMPTTFHNTGYRWLWCTDKEVSGTEYIVGGPINEWNWLKATFPSSRGAASILEVHPSRPLQLLLPLLNMSNRLVGYMLGNGMENSSELGSAVSALLQRMPPVRTGHALMTLMCLKDT